MMRFLIQPKTRVLKFHTAILTLAVLLCGFFLFVHPMFAAESALDAVASSSGLPTQSLPILIARIIRAVLMTLGILTVILILWGGFVYMTAGGDPAKMKKSKQIITNAVIGLVIIFTSYSLASWILGKLLAAAYGTGTVTSTTKKYAEPFGGSLGAGIIEQHFPARNATDVPRNTKIFVTFKEAIDPATIISEYKGDPTSTKLDPKAVEIFETAKGNKQALKDVSVSFSEDKKTFVFKPTGYLGNAEKTMSYTVVLNPSIKKEKGEAAFTGAYSSGYVWSFTVSTTIDLTPPRVLMVRPSSGTKSDRNKVIEIEFNEPMDPVASTGVYPAPQGGKAFLNIISSFAPKDPSVADATIAGTYEISNGYKTIGFTTVDACAKDPCGNTVYCLPAEKQISVMAKAATVDPTSLPQAKANGVFYDGLVDAAGNSLDGDGDGKSCGSDLDSVSCTLQAKNDHYTWGFSTTSKVDDTVPKISSLDPNVNQGGIDLLKDVTVTFNTLLQSSSVNSTNISIWPEPLYPMWFSVGVKDVQGKSIVNIMHPSLVSSSESANQLYWPVLTHGVKGDNQFCMYPAVGGACDGTDKSKPYCCSGVASASACKTETGNVLPLNNP